MKKFSNLLVLILGMFLLFSCSSENNSENSKKIKVMSYNSENKEIEIEIPLNPERVAVIDMATLDILDSLGLEDRVVGVADTKIDYLVKYINNENIHKIGTIKEVNMEKLIESNPDVIFIGGRLSKKYDELSKIAPVVYLRVDSEKGVFESTKKNSKIIASIFSKEENVDKLLSGFDERIENLKNNFSGKTAILGLTTSGNLNVLGNDGKLSLITKEIGFENVGLEFSNGKNNEKEKVATHGNEISFEYVLKKNPEYLFVMDRDFAINKSGAKLAKEIIENELIKKSDVYKNGKIIYLEHSNIWYTAEGGIKALDIMLKDLEKELNK